MRLFGLLVCCAGLASAQAIIEHAVAAGAGSVAGVAGKKISDGVDRVLGLANGALSRSQTQSVAPSPAKTQITGVPSPLAPLAEGSMAGAPGRPRAAARVSTESDHKMALWQMTTPRPPEPAAAAPRSPSPEDIAQIEQGTTRDQLLTKLGAPSSRVFIPEDGGLLEIYSYRSADGHIGTIRLTDGSVTSVRPATASR